MVHKRTSCIGSTIQSKQQFEELYEIIYDTGTSYDTGTKPPVSMTFQ